MSFKLKYTIAEFTKASLYLGEIFNASSPEHPTKRGFYTKAAKISEVAAPGFTNEPENFKVVNSDKLIEALDYKFAYNSPMDYLKELEEWAYRI